MRLTAVVTAIALAIATASPVFADGYYSHGGGWHGHGHGSNWVWGAPLLGATALGLGLAAPYYFGYGNPYYYRPTYPYPYPYAYPYAYPPARLCQGPYGAYQC